MVGETRLEKNRGGYYEIRWSEPEADTGRWRSRAVSTRTADLGIAQEVQRAFLRAERDEAAAVLRAKATTVGDLLDGYLASATARGVGPTTLICVKHLRGRFGAYAPCELTPDAVLDYGAARGVSDGTLRRELNTLTAALTWAVRHKRLDVAPVVDLPAEGAARAVFLDERTESDLFRLAAADVGKDGRLSRVGRFICIGLDTGARRAAILGLTWARVELGRTVIDFRDPAAKVTKKRRVATPITTRLLPVMQRAARERKDERTGAFVLDTNAPVRAEWDTFMAAHGFEGVTPHVLRHTRITLLLRAGVPVWDVSALVGASPDVIHSVYGHFVSDDRLRAMANKTYGRA